MAPPPDYRQIASQKAAQYGVPVDVFLRQISQESGFSPTAHSSAGADGIAQFIPSTAKAYGVNTKDPVSSLDGAARYDAALIKQYGSVARALSAYNSGKPDAYKDPNFAQGQTYNYVKSILGGSTPGGAGAASPSAQAPAAAGTPAPPAQPVDRRSQLLAALGGGNNLTGFYKQLGSALQARNAPAAPAPTTATLPDALTGAPQPQAPQRQGGSVGYLEKFANPYGLTVTSTTGGQHAEHSYHYQGRAVDFGGQPQSMAKLASAALAHPQDFAEVIYTGPGNTGRSILNGKVVPNSSLDKGLYAEHTNHVHLAR